MPIEYVFAGLPVSRLDAAVDWYERLVGRPPDRFPNEDEAVWQLADAVSLYLLADPNRAGNGLMALIVDHLDSELDAMQERGIAIGPIEAREGVYRKSVITDPDGNQVQVIQLAGDGETAAPNASPGGASERAEHDILQSD
jgi:catechol 2,3-dioxygenase-like lactoylglutathione lyase family enzyme